MPTITKSSLLCFHRSNDRRCFTTKLHSIPNQRRGGDSIMLECMDSALLLLQRWPLPESQNIKHHEVCNRYDHEEAESRGETRFSTYEPEWNHPHGSIRDDCHDDERNLQSTYTHAPFLAPEQDRASRAL